MEKKFNLIYALLSLLVVVVIAQSYMLYGYTKKSNEATQQKQVQLNTLPTHSLRASNSDPFEQMRIMQQQMQNSFGHINSLFADDPFFKEAFMGVGISPLSDITEDKSTYRVAIDIPGAKEQKIDIKTEGNNLIVKASAEKKVDTNDTNYIHMERYSQKFERNFSLPNDADLNALTHKYENGVLEITIPKKSSL